jgi:hypothetical protein
LNHHAQDVLNIFLGIEKQEGKKQQIIYPTRPQLWYEVMLSLKIVNPARVNRF